MNYYTPEQMAAWKANITDAADAADYVATMQEMRIVWAMEEEMEEEAAAERADQRDGAQQPLEVAAALLPGQRLGAGDLCRRRCLDLQGQARRHRLYHLRDEQRRGRCRCGCREWHQPPAQ